MIDKKIFLNSFQEQNKKTQRIWKTVEKKKAINAAVPVIKNTIFLNKRVTQYSDNNF